jgi:hypothetical protein
MLACVKMSGEIDSHPKQPGINKSIQACGLFSLLAQPAVCRRETKEDWELKNICMSRDFLPLSSHQPLRSLPLPRRVYTINKQKGH